MTERFRDFHLFSGEQANKLQSVNDTFALKVIVSDDKSLA